MAQNQIVEVKLELGHKAKCRDVPSLDGHTHDWVIFVKGAESVNLEHFVDRVVFWLHESYEVPKRVLKKPPFKVEQSGYAGFNVLIDVHFKNKEEPKMVRFQYDLFLHTESMPPVNHTRLEKLTFTHPTEDFKKKLLDGGGVQLGPTKSAEEDTKKEKIKTSKNMNTPNSNSQKIRKGTSSFKGKEFPKDKTKTIKNDEKSSKDSKSSKATSSTSTSKRSSTQDISKKQSKPYKTSGKHIDGGKSEKRKQVATDDDVPKKQQKLMQDEKSGNKLLSKSLQEPSSKSKDKKSSKKHKTVANNSTSSLFAKENSINIKELKKSQSEKSSSGSIKPKKDSKYKKEHEKSIKNQEKLKKSSKADHGKVVERSSTGSKSKTISPSIHSKTKSKESKSQSKRRESFSSDSDDSSSSSSDSSSDGESIPLRIKRTKRKPSTSDSSSESDEERKHKKAKHHAKQKIAINALKEQKRKKDMAEKSKESRVFTKPSSTPPIKDSSSKNISRHKLKEKRRQSAKENRSLISDSSIKASISKLNKTMPELGKPQSMENKDSHGHKSENRTPADASLKSSSGKSKKKKTDPKIVHKSVATDSGIKMTIKKPIAESSPSISNEAIKKISAKIGRNKEKSKNDSFGDTKQKSKFDFKNTKSNNKTETPQKDVEPEAKKVYKSKSHVSSDSSSESDDNTSMPSSYIPKAIHKKAIKEPKEFSNKIKLKKSPIKSPTSESLDMSYASAPSPIANSENEQGKFSLTQDEFDLIPTNDSVLAPANLTALSPMQTSIPDNKTSNIQENQPPVLDIDDNIYNEENEVDNDNINASEKPFTSGIYQQDSVATDGHNKKTQFDLDYYKSIMPTEGKYVTIRYDEYPKHPYPNMTTDLFKELQELQQKLADMTSVSCLKKIMTIVQKSGPCQKNLDDTFDFDLCSLDHRTITKIQKLVKAQQ